MEKRVIVNRHRAATALAADASGMDNDQRNRIRTLAASLQQLGTMLSAVGDTTCFHALGEAKSICERFGLRRELATVSFNLGHAYLEVESIRDINAAEAAYRDSLALYDEDDRLGRAQCHHQLGIVAWTRYQQGLSDSTDQRGLEKKSWLRWPLWRENNSIERGDLTRYLQTAADSHLTALALLPNDAHDIRAVAHNQLGIIFATTGNYEAAASHYHHAIRHREAAGNLYGAAQTRWNLANLYRITGRFADAHDYGWAALAVFESFDGRAADMIDKTRMLLTRIEAHDTKP